MASRPPPDISPRAFFETWLPGAFRDAIGPSGPAGTVPDGVIAVTLTDDGDEGGTWTLATVDGELSVTTSAPEKSDLHIYQSVTDWHLLLAGDPADLGVPGGLSPSALIEAVMGPSAMSALRGISGTIRLEVTGVANRTFALQVAFNDADTPVATVTMDLDTLTQIRTGALPAPQAFFAGKIQVTGDQMFVMQLAQVAMSRGAG